MLIGCVRGKEKYLRSQDSRSTREKTLNTHTNTQTHLRRARRPGQLAAAERPYWMLTTTAQHLDVSIVLLPLPVVFHSSFVLSKLRDRGQRGTELSIASQEPDSTGCWPLASPTQDVRCFQSQTCTPHKQSPSACLLHTSQPPSLIIGYIRWYWNSTTPPTLPVVPVSHIADLTDHWSLSFITGELSPHRCLDCLCDPYKRRWKETKGMVCMCEGRK